MKFIFYWNFRLNTVEIDTSKSSQVIYSNFCSSSSLGNLLTGVIQKKFVKRKLTALIKQCKLVIRFKVYINVTEWFE